MRWATGLGGSVGFGLLGSHASRAQAAAAMAIHHPNRFITCLVSSCGEVSTAIAVLAHEIPHEVGDFAILLHAGYSRRRALLANAMAAAAGVLGAILALVFLDAVPRLEPYFLSLATASFLYVAMSDLIPDLHRGTFDDNPIRQVLLVSAGIVTVMVL